MNGGQSPCGPHRMPKGPNEDVGVCANCFTPTFVMRPANETYGLHADDCCLTLHHQGECLPGGSGHPPAEIIRGYWPGMEQDIERARAKWR